jgi:hypothetical protein
VRKALKILDDNNGEIWAKLDAGTEEYYRRVNCSRTGFGKILNNILGAAQVRPVVIQSLWFRMQGMGPTVSEVIAYCGRLNAILSDGGKLKHIQLYTIVRDPADPAASPLSGDELNRIASIVELQVPIPVEIFY